MTLETVATVTSDGKLTIEAPKNLKPGQHRVRVELIDEELVESNSQKTVTQKTFKGRAVYDEEDMNRMSSELPPEKEWGKELQAE